MPSVASAAIENRLAVNFASAGGVASAQEVLARFACGEAEIGARSIEFIAACERSMIDKIAIFRGRVGKDRAHSGPVEL